MGSTLEFNDTLKLKRGNGFPTDVSVGSIHHFCIEGRRIYHLHPVRVFLVEEVDGFWNFVGQAMILRETIDAEKNETSGVFRITKLYSSSYAAQLNVNDAPPGKGATRETSKSIRRSPVKYVNEERSVHKATVKPKKAHR